MSTRTSSVQSDSIDTRQRLCIFHGTSVSTEEALAFVEEDITASLLLSKRVKAVNITAAGVGPRVLKSIGADTGTLRRLGFDSLFLSDCKFASEANSAFGAAEIKRAFLQSASDAVAIAGSDAVDMLGISTEELLEVCAGASIEAFSVLQQLPVGVSLEGVSAQTLLSTGLRKAKLAELGYSLSSVASQTRANAANLVKLGYTL